MSEEEKETEWNWGARSAIQGSHNIYERLCWEPNVRFIIGMAIIILGHTISMADESAKGRWVAVRTLLRDEIKRQYDVAKEQFKPGTPEEEKKYVRLGWKLLVYNKAYGLAKCMVGNPSSQNDIEKCFDTFMSEFRRYYGLAGYIESMPLPVVGKCLMRSRLFNEQFEFPPYEFLEGDGVDLIDLKKYDDCITTQ